MKKISNFTNTFGVRTKLFGLIGAISTIAIIGTTITWQNMVDQTKVMLQMKQKTEILTGLKDLQGMISEANLNAMDIIVDRDEWKVDKDRIEKNEKLASWLQSNKAKFIEWGAILGKSDELTTIFNKLDAVEKATSDLIAAVQRKDHNEKVYAHADDVIDEGCGTSQDSLSKIQDEFTESYNQSQHELETLSKSVLKTVLTANTFSVLALLLLGISITLSISRSIASSTSHLDNTARTLSDVTTSLEVGEKNLPKA